MPESKTGHTERRYETQDVSLHSMVYSALGLAALVILGFLASWFVFRYYVRVQKLGPPASPFDNARTLPPPPRLQVNPAEDLKAYHAEEDAILGSYGWADKSAGVVRIPIERAMELSLQRGFPVRKSAGAGEGRAEASNGPRPMAARVAAPSGRTGDQ
jgi:hypothetical protein